MPATINPCHLQEGTSFFIDGDRGVSRECTKVVDGGRGDGFLGSLNEARESAKDALSRLGQAGQDGGGRKT
jgi:hypothetical protein